jgi:5-histidylcysteine sulfoxide synthase
MEYSNHELLTAKTIILTNEDGLSLDKKREAILRYFNLTYTLYEKLFELLRDDSVYYMQPDPLRHSLLFYFGHTAVFYINKLKLAKVIDYRVNADFESVFAVGVDEMSWDDVNPINYNWKRISIDSIRQYRKQVREIVSNIIMDIELKLPITWESNMWVILMGCEHERIHLETSSVLFRQLPINCVRPSLFFKDCPSNPSAIPPLNVLLDVPGGEVNKGKPRDDSTYGWDCDYGENIQQISAFKATKFLVSNAEYYEFVCDGGYENPIFWLGEGKKFLKFIGRKHPKFWVPCHDSSHQTVYKLRTIAQITEMRWEWPVEVNQIEARAFCAWKSMKSSQLVRLPTENEYFRLRDYALPEKKSDYPAWKVAPGNANLEHYGSPCPVNEFGFDRGFFDIIGNVWQHTISPVQPFKGFKFHPLYDDFSVPTFDNRHFMIKGGSFISTGNEITPTARYAFRSHFYQHAGFRYIQPSAENSHEGAEKNYFMAPESDDFLAAALHQEWNENHTELPFPYISHALPLAHYTNSVLRTVNSGENLRLLQLNCGAGRTLFELSKLIQSAAPGKQDLIGLHSTARMIRLCCRLSERGELNYLLPSEGELHSIHEIDINGLHSADQRRNCSFFQCIDFSNLDPLKYNHFDCVVVDQLLEELERPVEFLQKIHNYLAVGGVLIIATDYTNKSSNSTQNHEQKLGGYREAGEIVTSTDRMAEILGKTFRALESRRENVPFVIQTGSRRNFRMKLLEFTAWKRVD